MVSTLSAHRGLLGAWDVPWRRSPAAREPAEVISHRAGVQPGPRLESQPLRLKGRAWGSVRGPSSHCWPSCLFWADRLPWREGKGW